MQPWQLEAAELARRIAARELSCVEAVRSSLERLEAVNPRINAVVDGGAEEALQAARQADAVVAVEHDHGAIKQTRSLELLQLLAQAAFPDLSFASALPHWPLLHGFPSCKRGTPCRHVCMVDIP